MIVIDDTLSKINDCHRMCVCCVCVNAMDWKSGNSIPIVSCTTQNALTCTHTHTFYLTHSAQVDFMYYSFGQDRGGIYVRLSTVIIPFDWK